MALTKTVVVDRIEVTETGQVFVRSATYVEEDGVRIAGPSYHREVFVPGTDVSMQPANVQAIAGAVWTSDVVAAEQDRARRAKE